MKKIMTFILLMGLMFCMSAPVSAKDSSKLSNKRIIRISHGQSETHPEHLALKKFEKYVEDRLGDKYDVQIFPNAILGSSQKAIELCQTGAIDFVVASTGNIETFAPVYEIFSMPYLFNNEKAYLKAMSDKNLTDGIYNSTNDSGFRTLTWYNAGTRNFYASKKIESPKDLEGMKIRVQPSPASVNMVTALGASASPMSFGEVYTAIQQGVIDGAENNELALTNNKHGEVAKYYCYNRHQMVPDLLIGSNSFLDSLSKKERKVFEDAAKVSTKYELKEWNKQVKDAKKKAKKMGVKFNNVNIDAFKKKEVKVQKQMLKDNPEIVKTYHKIQAINKEVEEDEKDSKHHE